MQVNKTFIGCSRALRSIAPADTHLDCLGHRSTSLGKWQTEFDMHLQHSLQTPEVISSSYLKRRDLTSFENPTTADQLRKANIGFELCFKQQSKQENTYHNLAYKFDSLTEFPDQTLTDHLDPVFVKTNSKSQNSDQAKPRLMTVNEELFEDRPERNTSFTSIRSSNKDLKADF